MKWLIIALLIVFVLNIADISITLIGLSKGGVELNPIYYMQDFQTFLLTKIILCLILFPVYIGVYVYLRQKFPKYVKVVWILIAFLIGFYTLIVVNNLITLSKLAG